ncbi:MAG: bifunctional folylpolyglutamate synthase/dihydrofolate synthase [Synechococcus sp.]
MDLSLDRMIRALDALDHPCGSVPAVQVVGTNGKGSIASFIHSGLVASGVRVGLTTSPHLVDWTERIRVDRCAIAPAVLRERLEGLQTLAARERLTPFELLITAALVHFDAQQVEWLVLEAGLGGRLDATTAHPLRPLLAVASIGLDHCEHLGGSLPAVAGEKAAAIQHGAVVISAPQEPEVATVLIERAAAMDAELRWVDPLDSDWVLGLEGRWQRSNAAVAKAVLERIQVMGGPVNAASIRAGLAATCWPGRLQRMGWRQHTVWMDGAHNPLAAAALRQERCHWPHAAQGMTWILGIQAHKQAPAMLEALLEPQDQAWIVPIPGHHSWTRSMLLSHNPAWAHQLLELPQAAVSDDGVRPVIRVLEHLEHQGWPAATPVIAGSLYLIGNLLTCPCLRQLS